jgi:hypothetical protein
MSLYNTYGERRIASYFMAQFFNEKGHNSAINSNSVVIMTAFSENNTH